MQEKRLKRVLIIGIIGILYSLFLVIDNLLNDISIPEMILAGGLFIFSIFFIIAQKRLSKKIK